MKSVNIRIKESELNRLKNNTPKEYESLSDFLRSAALKEVKGKTSSSEMTVFQNMLVDSENKIIMEIEKNRNILYSILEYVQFQDRKEVEILVEEYSRQLVDIWLQNFKTVKKYMTIEELEGSVEIDHLRDVVLDALMILQKQNKVIVNDNKLRWLE